jgi:ABC-type dipeptide/oligopeptide/nickel transport system permease component
VAWIAGFLRGDFGVSYTYRVPVADSELDWRVAAALAVTVDAFMNR